MLSCKKATELIEKNLVTKLSLREKVQLKMHKSLCDACTAYEKQSKKMDELFHKHLNSDSDQISNAVQNENLKEKIINTISEN